MSSLQRSREAAVGPDLRSFAALTLELARTEFKLRYMGSALGYAWSLLRPLLVFGVLYLVFAKVLRIGLVQNYPIYLLSGLVLWNYFLEATTSAAVSLVARRDILGRLRFPRLAVPLATSLTALFNLGLNLIVLFGLVFASGLTPRLSWLELIPLLLVIIVLATSIGILLSALYVRYRDVEPIWGAATNLLFYASPILYVVTFYPADVQRWAALNPIAAVMTELRHALIDPAAPTAAAAAGGGWMLVITGLFVLAIVGMAASVFVRDAPRLAENL
jgi:ABC-2 type transport system permease protein